MNMKCLVLSLNFFIVKGKFVVWILFCSDGYCCIELVMVLESWEDVYVFVFRWRFEDSLVN